jgi:NADH dehydrogenase
MNAVERRNDGTKRLPRVVVVGGGFAGLGAARALAGHPVRVTLIDQKNHHLFQPLLYQVATALLNAADIAIPLRQAVRAPNVEILLSAARTVDVARQVVVCSHGDVPYDRLILATGACDSYFGHTEWEAFAPGLKSVEDALEMRRRILLAYEMAERERDLARRRAWLTFVVVGGGPTGVELAGALAEISSVGLRREFRHIDPRDARILLLEGSPRLLAAWPDGLGRRARRDLERRGVEVRTGALVTGVDAEGITIGEARIPARTVLWGAGVRASSLGASLGQPRDRAGRVPVTPELTLPGRDDVYVVGDLAAATSEGRPVPGLAAAAIQEGRHAAHNVLRQVAGQAPLPFRYRDRGAFAVIGRGSAVGVAFKHLRLGGRLARLAWLGIHVAFLMGFRNRAAVLLGWAYSFFTRRRPMRLITGVSIDETDRAEALGPHPPDRRRAPEGTAGRPH